MEVFLRDISGKREAATNDGLSILFHAVDVMCRFDVAP
ncbi:hypothetical protein B0G69_2752 [Paraburkholderia sp. RAU2J]|nr:hypothetical protein B0G69_2752 [Paraburkholderia sp. RAU2J]